MDFLKYAVYRTAIPPSSRIHITRDTGYIRNAGFKGRKQTIGSKTRISIEELTYSAIVLLIHTLLIFMNCLTDFCIIGKGFRELFTGSRLETSMVKQYDIAHEPILRRTIDDLVRLCVTATNNPQACGQGVFIGGKTNFTGIIRAVWQSDIFGGCSVGEPVDTCVVQNRE